MQKMDLRRYAIAMILACSRLGWAHEVWVQPMLEMQGRTCFGYLHATSTYIDFYTPYYDCHRMAYERSEINAIKKIFHLKYSTRMCPVAVVVVTASEQTPAMSVDLYSTAKQYSQSADSPDTKCWGVQMYSKDKAEHLPESRRQPVVTPADVWSKSSVNRQGRKP